MTRKALVKIFNTKEIAPMFFVSLISADTNGTKEEIVEHLDILYECQHILPQIEDPKMREMVAGSIEILERDLREYEDEE